MDTAFPFGFPFPTAMYLTLYVLTLAVHVIFMNYVLAGTGYLAFAALLGGRDWSNEAMARVLRDWMPFALGATITAGIAPLLFVQVLYQQAFYTANLLLFHRWMSILPVLIVAFYLLYILKAKRVGNWRPSVQRFVAVTAFLCVAFTGYSWAENHSLSLERSLWPAFYETQSMMYRNWALLPRFLTWISGAVATMALLVLWQLRFYQTRNPPGGEPVEATAVHAKKLGALAIVALGVAVACAVWYWLWSDAPRRSAITSALSFPYLVAAGIGVVVELAGWVSLRVRPSHAALPVRGRATTVTATIPGKSLIVISTGLALTIVGTAVIRESIRVHAVDFAALMPAHARAAAVGAFWAFATFLVINAVLVWWSLRQVRHRSGAAERSCPPA